jgi:MarR family transcriptional regulator, 2-MHQ and catechol-resistance regulon repressor
MSISDNQAADPQAPFEKTPEPTILDRLGHAEVRRQVGRARDEYGPDFDAAPLTMLLLMHRVTAAFRSAESFELEAIGLTQTSFNILMVLHRSPQPMTMRDIAVAVSVQPPNLTAAVRDLEQRKFIRRRHNVNDKRSQLVETSRRGELLLKPFLERHFAFVETLFATISPPERLQLIDMLDRILTGVTDESGSRGLTEAVAAAAAHSWKA